MGTRTIIIRCLECLGTGLRRSPTARDMEEIAKAISDAETAALATGAAAEAANRHTQLAAAGLDGEFERWGVDALGHVADALVEARRDRDRAREKLALQPTWVYLDAERRRAGEEAAGRSMSDDDLRLCVEARERRNRADDRERAERDALLRVAKAARRFTRETSAGAAWDAYHELVAALEDDVVVEILDEEAAK